VMLTAYKDTVGRPYITIMATQRFTDVTVVFLFGQSRLLATAECSTASCTVIFGRLSSRVALLKKLKTEPLTGIEIHNGATTIIRKKVTLEEWDELREGLN